jgi:hypothetical protein
MLQAEFLRNACSVDVIFPYVIWFSSRPEFYTLPPLLTVFYTHLQCVTVAEIFYRVMIWQAPLM